jgi:hypothetical protein
VLAFSRCFALELKASKGNIKLNIFQPGMQKTGLTSVINVVQGWRDAEAVKKDSALALKYMGGNITESCSKVIPFVLPSCKANGQLFHGFSLFKLIRGAMKMQRELKIQTETAITSKR